LYTIIYWPFERQPEMMLPYLPHSSTINLCSCLEKEQRLLDGEGDSIEREPSCSLEVESLLGA
jgi:hypothetical protein